MTVCGGVQQCSWTHHGGWKPSTHNITHTAPFSSTAFTPLPTFRNIPPITTLVPPDIGPDFGNTEEMDGFTYVYWKLDCAVAMVPDLLIVITTLTEVPPEMYAPVTHITCIPIMYPYDCTTQGTPATVTLTMSPTFTPRLVPVMVRFVPPPNGPEVGETELNTGEGHWYDWLANVEEQVSGSTQLLIPLHHPQSYPVPMLTARQEVHTGMTAEQLYSVTEDEGGRLRSELNTHVLTLDDSKRINWVHNCTTVGPNKTDISYHSSGSNRKGDLEGEGSHLDRGDYITPLSPELQ